MRPPEFNQDNESSVILSLLPVTAAFFVAVGCWTQFALSGIYLKDSLGLSDVQFALLLSLPMLTGGLIAMIAGLVVSYWGARRVILICLAVLAMTLITAAFVNSYIGYLLVACGLGAAGGVFSAGLQMVLEQSPNASRGLVIGIFSSGMLGAGFSYALATAVHDAFSYQTIPLAYLLVLALVSLLFIVLSEPEPLHRRQFRRPDLTDLWRWITQPALSRLCLCYGFAAGVFVALALWLPDFMSAQFLLTVNEGAFLAQWFLVPGVLSQVMGGWMADRVGAANAATGALVLALVPLFLLSYPSMSLTIEGIGGPVHLRLRMPVFVEALLILLQGVTLGIAMGALLRLALDMAQENSGILHSCMFLCACLCAFLLTMLFGVANDLFGVRTIAFMLLFALGCLNCLMFYRQGRRQLRQRLLQGQ